MATTQPMVGSPVKPKPRKNWAKDDLEAFRASLSDERQEQPAPDIKPAPAPAPAEPPKAAEPAPPPSPPPVPEAPTQAPAFSFGLPQSTVPVTDTEKEELRKALQEREAKLAQMEADRAQHLADLETEREQRKALAEFKKEQELKERLNIDAIEWENLDKEQAKELTDKLLKPALMTNDEKIKEIERRQNEQIELLKKQLDEEKRAQSEKSMLTAREQTNKAVYKAHPDLDKIISRNEWAKLMLEPVAPNSTKTWGMILNEEYQNNNTDYIVDFVAAYKKTLPDIAEVTHVSTATASEEPSRKEASDLAPLSDAELQDLRMKVSRREITRQEFNAILAKHREANKALR